MKGLYSKYKTTIQAWKINHIDEFKEYTQNYYYDNYDIIKDTKNKKRNDKCRFLTEAKRMRNILLPPDDTQNT
jgi:septin family protein